MVSITGTAKSAHVLETPAPGDAVPVAATSSRDPGLREGGEAREAQPLPDVPEPTAAEVAKHCLIHRPFRMDCHACRLAKTTAKRHVRSIMERELRKWGGTNDM